MLRCLTLPTKRFMSNVRPSMKIRATVPSVYIVSTPFSSNHYNNDIDYGLLICRYNCIMMSQVIVTSIAYCNVITIAHRRQEPRTIVACVGVARGLAPHQLNATNEKKLTKSPLFLQCHFFSFFHVQH